MKHKNMQTTAVVVVEGQTDPILDTPLVRREDGSVKFLCTERRHTLTNTSTSVLIIL